MIETSNLSLEQSVAQVKGHIASDMGGEKVLLSVQKGKYYNLGEIGGRIWELAGKPIMVTQLIEALIAEYDVEPAECKEQVFSFLEHLLKEGLIETGS